MPHADRPSRVLMTADAVGGVWTYAAELCRELGRRGIAVTLAVMGPGPTVAQLTELASVTSVTVHARSFRLEWMADPWDDVAAAGEWLLDLESQVEPDVVHLNGYCHAAYPFRSPCLVVGHSCVLSWWQSVRGESAPVEWDPYAQLVRRGIRAAAAVAAPSAGMLATLTALYGPLPNPRVIANGRSPSPIAVDKEPLILTAGRLWDEAKNVAAVRDVAAAVRWPVAMAGATDRQDFGVTRYLGELESIELRRWMARASIYALPARYEPFGLSVLEAALARCALVLGDLPTLREIWGETAVYVDPDDRQALREALATLIEDSGRREALAAGAFARAAALTPQHMADQYCDTYRELTRERRPLLSLGAV